MKNKTARWLLCVVLALVLVASFVLVACKPDEEQPATYTLTFALGDHAAADAKAPDAIERKADEVVNLPNAPKAADGWEFDGWGSSKLAAGASFTMPAENTTLTAQWKQKPGPTPTTYTLTFALGDHAASDATAPEAKSYEAGAEVTLPDAPKADTGWQFDGWGDSKLAAGAKYTMPAQATTLTAQWKELPFTTDLFDLEYEWTQESEPTFFFALSKEDENFTLLADGEKMGNYAAEINADGTFKLTANDEIYDEGQSNPFSAVSVSLNGRTLTVNFTYGSKSYTKAVDIVKVDLVNYDGADGKLTVYVVKGSQEDLSGYAETSEPADKKLDTVAVGETVLTEEQYSAYAINSDITVTYTWKNLPFTTEAFNFDLSWEQKVTTTSGEKSIRVKITGEASGSKWSGEIAIYSLDDGADKLYNTTQTDYTTITIDESGSISISFGGFGVCSKGSGKLEGNTLSISFSAEKCQNPITYQADLVKLTFKNNSDEGEDKVIYANEGNKVDLDDWSLVDFSDTFTPEKYYFFAGWNDGKATYSNKDVITVAAETTLTPTWEKGYVVTYVVGYASNITSNNVQLSFYEDYTGAMRKSDAAKFQVPLSSISPYVPVTSANLISRDGYSVTWTCSCHPNQTLNPGDTHALTADVTLTAHWQLNRELKAEDFYGIWLAEESFFYTTDYDTVNFSKEGFRFKAEDSNFDNKIEVSSTSTDTDGNFIVKIGNFISTWELTFTFKEDSCNLSLRGPGYNKSVVLTRIKSYTVSFDLGKGVTLDGEEEGPVDQYVLPNGFAIEPNRENISRKGYIFEGWTDAQGNDFDFATTAITANTVLSAKWKQITNITVTFDANAEGDDVTDMPAQQEVAWQGTVTQPDKTPVREGYKFFGWALDETATSASALFDFSKPLEPTGESVTLYAIWKKIVTVTFDVNGDTTTVTVEAGAEGDPLTLPTYEGKLNDHDFVGWKLEGDLNAVTMYLPGSQVTYPYIDTTYVAVFGVTYTPDEASVNNKANYTKIILRDDEVTVGQAKTKLVVIVNKNNDAYSGTYTFSEESGLYTASLSGGGKVEFKISGSNFTLPDKFKGETYGYDLDYEMEVVLQIDGWGNAKLIDSYEGGDLATGTYEVLNSDTIRITFTVDTHDFVSVCFSDGGTMSVGINGVLVIGETVLLMGEPYVGVTLKGVNADEEEIYVPVYYGTPLDVSSVQFPEDGKELYGWLTESEEPFDASTPITEGITLTAVRHTCVTFNYDDEFGTVVRVWDENDGDKISGTYPEAGESYKDGFKFVGWLKGDSEDVLTPGETFTDVEAGTVYTAKWETDTPEAPFTTEMFDFTVIQVIGGQMVVFQYFVEDGGSFQIGYDYYAEIYNLQIAADGTITMEVEDYTYAGIEFVSGYLHGRHMSLVFSAGGTRYTFAGVLVEVTLKNFDHANGESKAYFFKGTSAKFGDYASSKVFDSGDEPSSFTVGETTYNGRYEDGEYVYETEKGNSGYVVNEDVAVTYNWVWTTDIPEKFSGTVNYLDDGEDEYLWQSIIAFNANGTGVINLYLAETPTTIAFTYTIAKGVITFVITSPESGYTASGTISGRAVIVTVEGNEVTYTFASILQKITVKDCDGQGTDTVLWLPRSSSLDGHDIAELYTGSETVAGLKVNGSDQALDSSVNVWGSDIEIEFVFKQDTPSVSLDEYVGEWECDDGSFEVFPSEYVAIKVTEEGKILFGEEEGSFTSDEYTPDSVEEQDGDVVVTITIGDGLHVVKITFKADGSAEVIVDNEELSHKTLTKKAE